MMEQDTSRATFKRLYALGYNPIPLSAGKTPACRWSDFHNRRPTTDEVAAFTGMKMDGIGVVCGGPTELMVLDIDDVQMVELVKPLLPTETLRQTAWYKTTRGFHLWFRRSPRLPATLGKLRRERVELLGFKHFAKCPPRESSATFGGGGLKAVHRLPEVPEKLLHWFCGETTLDSNRERSSSVAHFFLREGREPIPEGERNETLFRAACYLLRWRTHETYEELCMRLVNIAVEVDGLPREEALQCVDNAYVTVRPAKPGWQYEPWGGLHGDRVSDVA